jgi:hypothetical protein
VLTIVGYLNYRGQTAAFCGGQPLPLLQNLDKRSISTLFKPKNSEKRDYYSENKY